MVTPTDQKSTRFILCEKQYLYYNADADRVANAEMPLPRFPNGRYSSFFNPFKVNFFIDKNINLRWSFQLIKNLPENT